MQLASRLLALCVIFTILTVTAYASPETAAVQRPASRHNLVQNGGFEMDWMHNGVTSNTRFLLLDQCDWGYGQADGQPDLWVLPESARLDTSAAKFGRASLRLNGEASQVVYLCGETEPTEGGSGYSPFRALPADLAKYVRRRPMVFGAWCKTKDASTAPSLSVTIEYSPGDAAKAKNFDVAFSKGTHDWEYREIQIPAAPDSATMHAAVVHLIHRDGGVAWFDGVTAEEIEQPGAPIEPNLLPNGNFADVENNYPQGWSKPRLWTWVRRDYYRFTGWSHEDGKVAGGATPVTTEMGQALELSVLPGGNFAVASKPIALNQDSPRPLRVEAQVWADNLRWLEIMAKDEHGEWLPQQDFAGAWGTDANYRNRIVGAGSHDWEYVTKYFSPRKPVREVTLYLCVRGFDGKLMQRNLVGTARFTNVALRECGTSADDLKTRHVAIPVSSPNVKPASSPASIGDFGQRLWGDNTLTVRSSQKDIPPALSLLGTDGKTRALTTTRTPGDATSDFADWTASYRLIDLCRDWTNQYHIDGAATAAFGTPSLPVSIRVASAYLYPDEHLSVGVNLNIAAASLREVGKCRVFVKSPAGEKTLLETTDVASALWKQDDPRPALLHDGHVDARNLITLSLASDGLVMHPATDPSRDCVIGVELHDRAGATIVSQTSEPFGFMEKPRLPTLPERITKTTVDARGLLRVNGEPFFFRPFPIGPAGKTDLGAVGRMLNFPAGYKILAIPFPKDLIFDAAHDDEWRDKVRAFVAANKDNPKLFGYYFQHDGETMMWFDKWKEMAACQRKVAGWVREGDADHVILGAEWLFGTGTLTPESAKHFDFLDGLEVEPAFTWIPEFNTIRRQAGHGQYLLAGMECYYFHSPDMLRWRMYALLAAGASDVGICPSGMLAVRPETISYLRGLYGEEAALEPMLAGDEPAKRSSCDKPSILLWERESGGERYLVAMNRSPENATGQRFEITLPGEPGKIDALFENRSIHVTGNKFADQLESGFTVHVYRIKMQ